MDREEEALSRVLQCVLQAETEEVRANLNVCTSECIPILLTALPGRVSVPLPYAMPLADGRKLSNNWSAFEGPQRQLVAARWPDRHRRHLGLEYWAI